MESLSKLYHLPPELPDRWTTAWGEDEWGIWSEVEIVGVVQRFRWIEPGEFLVGSPEDELERESIEKQHEVALTNGLWLADTACTQQLWRVVTGENPSRFEGADRPVEKVSWEDCDAFMRKVNLEMPELNLRFPTEAEWEYACRAGTTTPFFFGETITTEQVSYHGNYPYASGSKGEYREQTVSVKALPPNELGLYEMHGNVWEWCSDWLGDYLPERVTDPGGPDNGVSRVLRGGSWFCNAGNCRSAIRYGRSPGRRRDDIGFRLARGPVESK